MSEANETNEAIRAENLVKSFGNIVALNGVSMRVSRGETLGVLGDNGAGKSTLIKILTGYHQPDSGRYSSTIGRLRSLRSTTPASAASNASTRTWPWSTGSASTTTCF